MNYSNGKIYTIRYRNDNSLIYVGSTCQELYKRFSKHKEYIIYDLSRKTNSLLYEKMRETNDINNWYIELYELYPCKNREELRKREGEIIREIGNLNICIAGRTRKEWNKEHSLHNINKSQEWYKNNIEHKREYDKKRREDKADIIKEKKSEYNKNLPYIICECGMNIKINSMKNHIKTKRHQSLSMINTETGTSSS